MDQHKTVIDRYKNTSLNVAVSGSRGMVGSALCQFLQLANHNVYRLTKTVKESTDIFWDIQKQEIDHEKLSQIDAIVHLAGENIAGFWSAKKKRAIYDSRIQSTTLLANAINKTNVPNFLCASADGYYGLNPEGICTESAPSGNSFLANVCKDWESAANKAQARCVNMRFSMVLSPHAGALQKLLLPAKLHIQLPLADKLSWITLDDLIYQIYHLLMTPSLSGPFNLASPNPTNKEEFNKALFSAIQKRAFFTLPKSLILLANKEMAENSLLNNVHSYPEKLLASNAHFYYPHIQDALKSILARKD